MCEFTITIIIRSCAMNKEEKFVRDRISPLIFDKTWNKCSKTGHVYIIESSGLFKIGKSTQVAKRLKGFNTTLPQDVIVHKVIASDDITELEKSLHVRFCKYHVKGEWYAISIEDVNSIDE